MATRLLESYLDFVEQTDPRELPVPIPGDFTWEAGAFQELAQSEGVGFDVQPIGKSRSGKYDLAGLMLGTGPLRVSITAGAHSDEPAGPMAAEMLVHWLLATSEGRGLLEETSWSICPHVNPDGAAKNAAWFRPATPDPFDYAHHVLREPPPNDVEFNYPGEAPGAPPPRPENRAVAEFLHTGSPYDLHASLHGMGTAEGAWWLIGKEWVERTKELREELARLFEKLDLGVHDIDRHGDKGFTRIERGFSTTPTCTAMREFFERQDDEEMASNFRPSSMEFVQSLGGDPLVMVSEIPIFRIHGGGEIPDPPGEETPFLRLRPRMGEARAKLRENDDPGPLRALIEEFDIRPVPWKTQVQAVGGGVLEAVRFLLERENSA